MDSVIYVGDDLESPVFTFSNQQGIDNLISCSSEQYANIVGEELAIDTLTFVADDSGLDTQISFDLVPSGTPVRYYYGEKLIGNFYVVKLVRTSAHQWTFQCESFIGFLDKSNFYGAYCEESDEMTFKNMVDLILLTDGLRVYSPLKSLSIDGPSFDYSEYGIDNSKVCSVIHFRYDGLHAFIRTKKTLATRVHLWGTSNDDGVASNSYPGIRCLYADISKSDVNDLFSETIPLTFNFGAIGKMPYGDTGLKLGDISPGDDVTVVIDPIQKTVTFNGITRSYVHSLSSDTKLNLSLYGAKKLYGSTTAYGFSYEVKMTWYRCAIDDVQYKLYENIVNGGYVMKKVGPNGFLNDYFSFRNDYASSLSRYSYSYDDHLSEFEQNYPISAPDIVSQNAAKNAKYLNGCDEIVISGGIPVTTKRDALYRLMFAYGITVTKDTDGNYCFTLLSSNTTPIESNKIFENGEVSFENTVRSIKVPWYEASPTESSSEIFKNTDGSIIPGGAYVVDFQGNYYNDVRDRSGTFPVSVFNNRVCAFCRGGVELFGSKINITEHHKTFTVDNPYATADASIAECHLITFANVNNVGSRLVAYYENLVKIRNAIVYQDEQLGRKFSFESPFGESTDGYLSHVSLTAHGIMRAECEFISNYTPPILPKSYKNCIALTGSGTFDLPADAVFPINVVLIGGGAGGNSGLAGLEGEATKAVGAFSGSGGAGGSGGSGGDAANVLSVLISDVSVRRFAYSCGVGGNGGSANYNPGFASLGSYGGNTTFGSYSSATGEKLINGFYNPLDRTTYATPGNKGRAGAKGGSLLVISPWMAIGMPGGYNGGGEIAGGEPSDAIFGGEYHSFIISGACGGGASYTNVGGDATAPTRKSSTHYVNGSGGAGADGGTGSHEPLYGEGGVGGDGGGGGGASGSGDPKYTDYTFDIGRGGRGGKGGAGGKGGDGCVFVFYNKEGEV